MRCRCTLRKPVAELLSDEANQVYGHMDQIARVFFTDVGVTVGVQDVTDRGIVHTIRADCFTNHEGGKDVVASIVCCTDCCPVDYLCDEMIRVLVRSFYQRRAVCCANLCLRGLPLHHMTNEHWEGRRIQWGLGREILERHSSCPWLPLVLYGDDDDVRPPPSHALDDLRELCSPNNRFPLSRELILRRLPHAEYRRRRHVCMRLEWSYEWILPCTPLPKGGCVTLFQLAAHVARKTFRSPRVISDNVPPFLADAVLTGHVVSKLVLVPHPYKKGTRI